MKKRTPYILVVIALIVVAFGYYIIDGFENDSNSICDQEYALCTSAPCIPDPANPGKAICFCQMHNGKSFGQTSCKNRAPFIDAHGTHFVKSTYSFAEYDSKKTMLCPDGTPWTFCLDKQCTVDPKDPSRAICACDIYRTGRFLTLGGNCDTKTCETGYWSGATVDDVGVAMKVLVKAMGLQEEPENYCPDAEVQ